MADLGDCCRALILVGAVLSLARCAEEQGPIFHDLSQTEVDHGFLVVFDAKDAIARILPPFSYDGDQLVSGSAPRWTVEPGEASAVLVLFGDDSLARVTPLYVPDRAGEIGVKVGDALDCPEGRYRDSALRQFAIPLPEDVQLLRFSPDGQPGSEEHPSLAEIPTLGAIRLEIPTDPKLCTPRDGRRLQPFGATQYLLEPGGSVLGRPTIFADRRIGGLVRVDAERVIATGHRYVYLFERGQGFADDATHVVEPATGFHLNQLAADRIERQPGKTRIFAVGSEIPPGEGGCIAELSLDAEGLHHVETVTVSRELWDVTVTRKGTVLAVGAQGTLLAREHGELGYRGQDLGSGEPRRIIQLEGDDRVLIGGQDGLLLLGEPLVDRFASIAPEGLSWVGNHFRALASFAAPVGTGSELWVSASKGAFGRRRAGAGSWETWDPVVAPEYAECTSEGALGERKCGGIELAQTLPRLATHSGVGTGDRIFAPPETCAVVLELSRSFPCASVLQLEGIEPRDGSGMATEAISIYENWLTIGTDDGGVLELALP